MALVRFGPAMGPQVYQQVQFLYRLAAAAGMLAFIMRRVPFGPFVQDSFE